MEYIYFEGGGMDGRIFDINGDLTGLRLYFDGSKVLGTPKGLYEKTASKIQIGDTERTIWRYVEVPPA